MRYTERQIELNRLRRERQRKKLKTFLTLLVCVALSAGIVGTIFFAPFFNVAEIYAVGNSRLSEDRIITASEIQVGENIFRTSTQRIISNVTSEPLVHEANVRRIFPNRLRIWVREREPQANVAVGDLFAVIDERGFILMELQEQPYNVPVIHGLNVDRLSARPGTRISAHNSANMEVAITLLNEIIEIGMIDSVISIDVTRLTRIELNYEMRVTVIIGEADELEYKIRLLQHIMTTQIAPHEHGIFDMSIDPPYFNRTN